MGMSGVPADMVGHSISPATLGIIHFFIFAPEVYHYGNSYSMFASFRGGNITRASQILKSDSPMGPFLHHKQPKSNDSV